MLGASPTPTWDHSYSWQMCELVSRMAARGLLAFPWMIPRFLSLLSSPLQSLLSVLHSPCYSVSPSFPAVSSVGIVRGLLLWHASLSFLLQAKKPSSSSLSLGSCCVNLSLLFSFLFTLLYSQEMYPPFQLCSCNKRAPLAFVFSTLHLLAVIDFLIIFFFLSPPNQTVKTGGVEGELTSVQFCWGCKLDPSIYLRRKTNKMAILWGAHIAKLCSEKICKPSFPLWVAKWLFKAI